MNQEDYNATLWHVYTVRTFDARLARLLAEKIVDDASALGQRPHGGGDLVAHYQGKIAEICFEHFLHRCGIQYIEQCRGLFGEETPRSDHVDFLVRHNGDFKTCDVKGGVLPAGMAFASVPLDSYGLTVPVMQARKDSTLLYAHVFLSANMEQAVFAGWAYRWEVREADVCKGVNGKPEYHKVPVGRLHSPRELYRLSQDAGAVESMEKILA